MTYLELETEPREIHLRKTHAFPIFLKTLPHHKKYSCDKLLNIDKTCLRLPLRLA